MSNVRRWLWLPITLGILTSAALVVRYGYLPGDVRAEMGDVTAPMRITEVEIEGWMDQLRMRGGANVAVRTARCGPIFCAEVADLRVPITIETFPHLGARGRLRPSHTALLARAREQVYVLGEAVDDKRLPPRVMSWSSAPAYVRDAFEGRTRTGTAASGFGGDRIVFSTALLPRSGWILAREVSGDALVEALLGRIAFDVSLVALLLLFALAYARTRFRVARMRRDQELAAVRANFVAAVSHELRTPIAQIRLFADLLRNDKLKGGEETARAYDIIDKESGRLAILVENVLTYARLTRGDRGPTLPPAGHSTDVARDIEYAVDAFSPLAAEKDVRIHRDTTATSIAAIDSQALRQIMFNFMENAVKYGPRGQTITVGSSDVNGRVRIWVGDHGPGVNDAEHSSIWESFARGSAAQASNATGSGIGLAVVRELVDQYGGKAWVEANKGGGACFIVEFASRPTPYVRD